VKTVARITYTVLVETLNGAQSINQWHSLHLCVMVVCTLKPQLFGTVLRTFSKKNCPYKMKRYSGDILFLLLFSKDNFMVDNSVIICVIVTVL